MGPKSSTVPGPMRSESGTAAFCHISYIVSDIRLSAYVCRRLRVYYKTASGSGLDSIIGFQRAADERMEIS